MASIQAANDRDLLIDGYLSELLRMCEPLVLKDGYKAGQAGNVEVCSLRLRLLAAKSSSRTPVHCAVRLLQTVDTFTAGSS
jgi:hypothetical protein